MKTAELTGAHLNYWAAKALGDKWDCFHKLRFSPDGLQVLVAPAISIEDNAEDFLPSELWSHGGPIVEREVISVYEDPYWFKGKYGTPRFLAGYELAAEDGQYYGEDTGSGPAQLMSKHTMGGDNYLEAAMRAFVASKYGEEVPDV